MNKYILLSATALVAVLSFNAKAADSATGTAQVEVVKSIDIEHTGTALNFGSVYARDGNTVTIGTNGNRSEGEGYGTTSADQFTISGPSGRSVTVAFPASAAMTKTGGGTLTATLTPSQTGSITLTSTDVVIDVGGTVAITSSTPLGSYSGTYNVTITY